MIEDPSEIQYELEKAYHIAMEGRQGPVLLDIPMNIFRAEIDSLSIKKIECKKKQIQPALPIEKIVGIINTARRPMCLIGGGVMSAGAEQLVEQFIDLTGIPFITSLMGKGAVNETLPQYMGMLGSYGNRMANITVHESDVLIVLGSRLDTRQTGTKYKDFLKNGCIIHVDIDRGELDEHRIDEKRIKVVGDVKEFISTILPKLADFKIEKGWIDYCLRIKECYNQEEEIERFVRNKAPYQLIQKLNEYVKTDDIVTVDIGQNQMWTAQTLKMKKGMRFLTSGGLAPMGYAIPVSIGVAFATAYGRKVWAIAGDGGFHISTQALMLISQYKLPISVVVINNESLGMITQFQDLYFDSLYAGTDSSGGYCVPHIEHLAQAYNIPYYKVCSRDLSNRSLFDKIAAERYVLVEYTTEGKTKVSPKLEFDKPINCPSPLLPDDEQKEIAYDA
jgi:acetolactate synthase-1/2/3 large subunit